MGNFNIESVLTCLVFSRSSCCWLSKCILKTQNLFEEFNFFQIYLFFSFSFFLAFSIFASFCKQTIQLWPSNDWNLSKKLHIYKLLEGAEKLRPLMLQPTFVLFLQMNILIKAEKSQSQAESKINWRRLRRSIKNRSAIKIHLKHIVCD